MADGYWLWAIGTLFVEFVQSVAKMPFVDFASFAVPMLRGPSCPSWIKSRYNNLSTLLVKEYL
ncbi:hypothetical protein SE18_06030 [Herpetosiphon geysericola]|uniref:Uncharacterized protein n=1 Tax=Herpetosiphon geysericola TaxID=70996 RepID=A0A0P6YJ74_9CHLR|nr:hypothetical protein SE18_06030 [Herpetosiphon geysericola]